MTEVLSSPLMVRALLVAVLVGATAPIIGTYLVQRRLALLGDGIGHIALTGVAIGWLTGTAVGTVAPEDLALPGAMVISVIGAVGIEWLRSTGKVGGDVALAILFYGGVAGGVLLIKVAGGTSANLMTYLFGSIATVSEQDVWWTAVLAVLVVAVGLGLKGQLLAVSHDEEFAAASGLNVRALTMTLAALAALTVTVSMQAVGLLLVSAIMIVPVAAAQIVTRSFAQTMALASLIGVSVAVTGLLYTYWHDLPAGAVVVVLAIGVYAALGLGRRATQLVAGRA
jgi:zinc transport system permease protein